MALSEDQKAILRLLSQRGADGYDDLAALMGIGAGEVHAKAKGAAAQLESEGIPAPEIPPPPGGDAAASPAPAAPKAAPAEPAPEPPPPAAVPAPEPTPTAASPAPPARPKRTPPPRPNISLPGGGGARTAIAAGALVLVALVAILVVGGGDDSGEQTSGSGNGSEQAVNTANAKETTQAVLQSVDGSDASGVAIFGRVKNSLALQVEASGLEPTGKGESYTIWLYQSPRKMLPLASTRVGENGKIAAQVEVPTEVLAYLANETFDQIDVSRTTDATLKASLAKATQERKAPIYTGTDVLRGRIEGPIIGAALP